MGLRVVTASDGSGPCTHAVSCRCEWPCRWQSNRACTVHTNACGRPECVNGALGRCKERGGRNRAVRAVASSGVAWHGPCSRGVARPLGRSNAHLKGLGCWPRNIAPGPPRRLTSRRPPPPPAHGIGRRSQPVAPTDPTRYTRTTAAGYADADKKEQPAVAGCSMGGGAPPARAPGLAVRPVQDDDTARTHMLPACTPCAGLCCAVLCYAGDAAALGHDDPGQRVQVGAEHGPHVRVPCE